MIATDHIHMHACIYKMRSGSMHVEVYIVHMQVAQRTFAYGRCSVLIHMHDAQ